MLLLMISLMLLQYLYRHSRYVMKFTAKNMICFIDNSYQHIQETIIDVQ